jgi:CDP-diacylglycerol--glycerol-3-phosphate 3-phosphatidyltransferase
MLDAKAREAMAGFYDWTGRTLTRVGFTANSLTALGIGLTAVAAWRLLDGAFLAGGIILIGGSILDFCDGAVAKVRGTASTLGAFIDSVSDRLSDALVFGALLWFFFGDSNELAAAATLTAFVLAGLTSYIRAKAEALGYDCKVGILERAERLILLCVGLILGFIDVMLWVIAGLAAITVGQRVVHVFRQSRARIP